MQREILFKAKRKDNGEWVYGQLVFDKDKIPFIVEEVERQNQDEVTDLYATIWYEVIPETICQYTGLKDKNSVKIFENDILSGVHYKFIVKWNKHRMSFGLFTFMKEIDEGLPVNVKDFIPYKKIGNIFDEEVK